MKHLTGILTLFLMLFVIDGFGQSKGDRIILGEEHAIQEVRQAIAEKKDKPFYATLIKDKKMAVSIAEAIVFNIYGKNEIIKERPYETYLVDGFWYISGTLPKNMDGGTFEIILNANNAQVIKLVHGK